MDYMGILRESWDVTKRNRSLWILGLFASGGAALSSRSSWNSNSSSSGSRPTGWNPPPPGTIHSPNDALQYVLDQAGRQTHMPMGTPAQWWLAIGLVAAVIVTLTIVLWAVGIWARGGLIEQTREAVAGRTATASAGWRSGLRSWGRVFLVGFLLGLPLFVLGVLGFFVAVGFGLPALMAGLHGAATAGLVGMGLALSVIGLAALAVSVVVSMIEEVALRNAVLSNRLAFDSIRDAWIALRAKQGIASMWLVMILVNIAAAIGAGILFIPVALVGVVVVGGSVYAAGPHMFWLATPFVVLLIALALLFKAIFTTFRNTAWTSFYLRIQGPSTGTQPPTTATPVAE
jgi:hypothetical protein